MFRRHKRLLRSSTILAEDGGSPIIALVAHDAPDPLADLAAIPDPQERLLWITDRGRRAPPLAASLRTAAHRVPGCVSAVWLVDESSPESCRFLGDAEAPILRGLVALACARATGRAPAETAADQTDIVTALGIERHLTPTRVHGLRQLQAHIRRLAAQHISS